MAYRLRRFAKTGSPSAVNLRVAQQRNAAPVVESWTYPGGSGSSASGSLTLSGSATWVVPSITGLLELAATATAVGIVTTPGQVSGSQRLTYGLSGTTATLRLSGSQHGPDLVGATTGGSMSGTSTTTTTITEG